MLVDRYSNKDKEEWDKFIKNCKNSHFMFFREFIQYHKNRYLDFSLIIRDDKKKILAVLPANISDGILYSHQGLTFGGMCISRNIKTQEVYNIFCSIINFLKSKKIKKIIYKRMPDFYSTYPSQEDLYSLFLLNAKMYRRDVSVAIDLQNPIPFQKMRMRKVNKGLSSGIIVEETRSLNIFWDILTKVLKKKHNAKPAHTFSEIEKLQSKFPNNIRCFVAKKENNIHAGVLIFETSTVAHTQYLAMSDLGRNLGALDVIIFKLVNSVFKKKRYFNFGISSEAGGKKLNEGLIFQKEGFGARALIHDFYEIEV